MGNVLPFVANGAKIVVPKARAIVPYPFDPAFEAGLVTALCMRQKLWRMLAEHLEAEALTSEVARLAFGAAKEVEAATGRPSSSVLEVVQCLRRRVDSGKLEIEKVAEVFDYFDAAQGCGLMDNDGLIGQVKPVLMRRAEREAVDGTLSAFTNRGSILDAVKPLERVVSIGEAVTLEQALMGAEGVEVIDNARHVARLRTGIYELDAVLDGGVRRGTAGMFLGEGSAGKSFALVQVAIAAAVQGIPVAYATLELSAATVHARLMANLTGVPVDVILDNPRTCGALEEKQRIELSCAIAPVMVADFPARVTCPDDFFRWVAGLEERLGFAFGLLVVDYADKCGSGAKRGRSEESSYEAFGSIYDQLFNWGKANDKWVWTASQATRGGNRRGQTLGLDDVSDSINKTRNFDTVITLNPSDEFTMMTFGIAKNRHGKRGVSAGPLPTEFERGRIVPVTHS